MKQEFFTALLKGRSLLNWIDYSPEEITLLLNFASQVKIESREGVTQRRFAGKTLAMLFEKRSTRTRCAFETAFAEEGGHPVFLSSQDIQLGSKESLEDTARVLGRMFSAIEFRGYAQKTVELLAHYSGVPVYNGLTDLYHPTQVLADVMTLQEEFGTLQGLHVVFSGDGRNNVARSLMLICAKLGINCTVISPAELYPADDIRDIIAPFAEQSGARIKVTSDSDDVAGADCVYTDVWASMGEENLQAERAALLTPYQVNEALFAKIENPRAIFMHCLPAIRGEEVTADIIDGQRSRVWDEAENRKHTIKAIMLATI
jgi:ornithine carbamoyltransferase